jgi:hypothetical protein
VRCAGGTITDSHSHEITEGVPLEDRGGPVTLRDVVGMERE